MGVKRPLAGAAEATAPDGAVSCDEAAVLAVAGPPKNCDRSDA